MRALHVVNNKKCSHILGKYDKVKLERVWECMKLKSGESKMEWSNATIYASRVWSYSDCASQGIQFFRGEYSPTKLLTAGMLS